MRITLALLATMIICVLATGCAPGRGSDVANQANRRCALYGGVLSTDWNGESFVCGDRKARGF